VTFAVRARFRITIALGEVAETGAEADAEPFLKRMVQ
jgi:hypothetical protein